MLHANMATGAGARSWWPLVLIHRWCQMVSYKVAGGKARLPWAPVRHTGCHGQLLAGCQQLPVLPGGLAWHGMAGRGAMAWRGIPTGHDGPNWEAGERVEETEVLPNLGGR